VRVGLELLPQPADVHVHGPGFGRGLIPPDRVEQLVAREQHAGVPHQKGEELQLLRRKAGDAEDRGEQSDRAE